MSEIRYNLFREQKAFTLIELMIVITVISILSAIAIILFSVYRVRTFNSAALSDLQHLSSSEMVFINDFSMYGATESAANSGACAGGANRTGNVLSFGLLPGMLYFISSQDIVGNQRVIEIGLSKDNSLYVVTAQQGSPSDMYTSQSKHINGNIVYGKDNDSSDLYQNFDLFGAGAMLTIANIVNPTQSDDFKLAAGAGWVIK